MIARLFMLLHDAICNDSGCDGVAFKWRQRTAAAAALAIAPGAYLVGGRIFAIAKPAAGGFFWGR